MTANAFDEDTQHAKDAGMDGHIAKPIDLGVLVDAVSKHLLKTRPDMYTGGQIIRSAIQIGYLVIIFTLGGYTPWGMTWLLVGGCLGITLPMFYFTYK